MITITNLKKTFKGPPAINALKGVNLNIKKGSIFGILGQNGAGKTTLISILNGLVQASSGDVNIMDLDIKKDIYKIRSFSSLIPQHLAFYDELTVLENLKYFAGVLKLSNDVRKKQIEKAVEINKLEKTLSQKSCKLSGGQKKRLNIAIGLLNEPQLLFFDEPTVGIDPETRNEILDSIKSLADDGKTIIYTSHYMNEIERICSDVAILNEGQVIKNAPLSQLLNQEGSVWIDIYHCEITKLKAIFKSLNFIRIEDSTKLISSRTDANSIAQVLKIIEENKIVLRSCKYSSSDLESLFISLTSKIGEDNV